jgi:hypothetical protein
LIVFERPGTPYDAVMDEHRDDEEMQPTVIRSVCDKLRIDPAELGFTIP